MAVMTKPILSVTEQKLISFHALAEFHRRSLGVTWAISSQKDAFMFWNFQRYGSTKGNGRVALAEVCELADRLDVTLKLWTVCLKLIPYYEGFGFEQYGLVRGVMMLYRDPK